MESENAIVRCLFDNGGWETALFDFGECCEYGYACCCPCVLMHDIARQAPPTGGLETSCYGCVESLLVDCPVLFCASQFSTRCCDWITDRPAVSQYIQDTENNASSDWTAYIETAGLNRLMHSDRTPHWINDRKGFDLESGDSEDWWPLAWCGFYARELFQGTLMCRFCPIECCCCCSSTPRMPLCFSLLLCSLYPLALCPMACILRSAIAQRSEIHESSFHTCVVTFCCLPCSMAQMENQVRPPASRRSTWKGGGSGVATTKVAPNVNNFMAPSSPSRSSSSAAKKGRANYNEREDDSSDDDDAKGGLFF